jgi:hypothetical protein
MHSLCPTLVGECGREPFVDVVQGCPRIAWESQRLSTCANFTTISTQTRTTDEKFSFFYTEPVMEYSHGVLEDSDDGVQ